MVVVLPPLQVPLQLRSLSRVLPRGEKKVRPA